jgi:hypothetical protein
MVVGFSTGGKVISTSEDSTVLPLRATDAALLLLYHFNVLELWPDAHTMVNQAAVCAFE